MSFSSLKMVFGPLPPATGPHGSPVKEPTVVMVKRAFLPLQVKGKEQQKLQAVETVTSVSRRDLALCLTAASLAGATFFLPEPVEARVVKPEIRRKIKEKLEMLRERAGLSRPKNENGEKTAPPPPQPSSPLPLPPIPLPALPNLRKSPGESLVVATLP